MAELPATSPAFERQRAFNEKTAGSWADYAAHRRQVTRHLLSLAKPDSKLLVLGAGNCNDVELPALVSAYCEVGCSIGIRPH